MTSRKAWFGCGSVVSAFAVLIAAVWMKSVCGADTYPTHEIQIIVASAAGGNQDIVARKLADKLARRIKTQVIVQNKPGANGFIAAEATANAPADGYTLMLVSSSVLVANPSLFRKLPYDPKKDFEPVALIGRGSPIVLVNPALPIQSLAEFIAYAKARPGRVTYGSPGIGSGQHIAGSLLEYVASTELLHVPYKNQPQIMSDLISGQIDSFIEFGASSVAQINSGKVRAIAIAGPNRKPLVPDVPTAREQGFPQLELWSWLGFVAPAHTPKHLVALLNRELNAAIQEKDFADWVESLGSELMIGTPEDFAKYISSESGRWAKLIQNAKIHPE